MLGGFNQVGPSEIAHTLDAYRRLPYGWRTSPVGPPTDLHMWQQWLGQPWCRLASAHVPTGMHFPSHERRGQSTAERVQELEKHVPVLREPAARIAWLRDREDALAWHVRKLGELDPAYGRSTR